jgi:methionyl aminopeptidase
MTTAGGQAVRLGGDGWAIFSQDGSLAAHFEFTVAIAEDGPRILTPWHREAEESARFANIPGRAQVG